MSVAWTPPAICSWIAVETPGSSICPGCISRTHVTLWTEVWRTVFFSFGDRMPGRARGSMRPKNALSRRGFRGLLAREFSRLGGRKRITRRDKEAIVTGRENRKTLLLTHFALCLFCSADVYHIQSCHNHTVCLARAQTEQLLVSVLCSFRNGAVLLGRCLLRDDEACRLCEVPCHRYATAMLVRAELAACLNALNAQAALRSSLWRPQLARAKGVLGCSLRLRTLP